MQCWKEPRVYRSWGKGTDEGDRRDLGLQANIIGISSFSAWLKNNLSNQFND